MKKQSKTTKEIKMKFKNLINPFTYIAGWQAFGIGIAFVLLMGVVGSLSGVYFDGALDAHLSKRGNFYHSFLFLGIDIVCVTLFMWIAALFFSKNVRLIDMLGTMTLSKAPMLIVACMGFMVSEEMVFSLSGNPLAILTMPSLIVFSMLIIPFIVWSIALMYNAFKVSSGMKGNRTIFVFIAALLLAEIVSKIIIAYIV